jgi:hypothetical protein
VPPRPPISRSGNTEDSGSKGLSARDGHDGAPTIVSRKATAHSDCQALAIEAIAEVLYTFPSADGRLAPSGLRRFILPSRSRFPLVNKTRCGKAEREHASQSPGRRMMYSEESRLRLARCSIETGAGIDGKQTRYTQVSYAGTEAIHHQFSRRLPRALSDYPASPGMPHPPDREGTLAPR